MPPLPSLFVSHGAPTFAVEPGLVGPRLTRLGRLLPRPRAIVVVSPHWRTRQARVSASTRPPTLHDFQGFSAELHQIEYPADGYPALAVAITETLDADGWDAGLDPDRGLDHGVWVPLRYLYPVADVAVVQVSMPRGLNAESAFSFGRALAPLAHEDVLIVGSGSLTHNLEEFHSGGDAAYATEFVAWIREAVVGGDTKRLQNALERAPHARRAHPTPEHFWPLLVAAGASNDARTGTVIEGGMTHGVLAMDAFLFGCSISVET